MPTSWPAHSALTLRCKGNRIEFPIWRSRTWWAPFAAATLFAGLGYCAWNFGMPSWAGGMF